MFWKKSSLKELLPPPVKVAHGEYSMILSAHDDPSRPTTSLVERSLCAIEKAAKVDLSNVSSRLKQGPRFPDIWPGEHYKLLAGLTVALKAKRVVEIGTSTGLSALCIKEALPDDGQLDTFDIIPWQSYPNTVFQGSDFDARLRHHVTDLSVSFDRYRDLLSEADLFFIDVTHDGDLERKLLDLIQTIQFPKPIYLLFDDIRVWTMLKMWREVRLPKIDLTSFGHWSGTGLVELNG